MFDENRFREVIREELVKVLHQLGLKPSPPAKEASGSDAWWGIDDVARHLGRSTSWVYKRVAEGAIPYFHVGPAVRFVPAKVKEWAPTWKPSRGPKRRGTGEPNAV